MKTRIRQAEIEDVDALVPLFDAYRQFYDQPSDLSRARNWLRARIGANESAVLIAERGDEVVGFTQLYPMYSSVQTARIFVLNDLYVSPEQRRLGIARALLKAAIEHARNDGASRLQLETSRRNEAARTLYRDAGWREDDTQWYSVLL
ncbi:GNAT family N-acetyltransferase [Lysobacter pythonis]|uniref:GNAT family N-acetyltransferase n=1 Tax=Solilutibacter pythonis TaxID=2483112 RepID=A0A3M2HIC6_9GAMM|nr:GNAT family N-acetyltransferase [Lysobacter pythonis]RMH89481.1 GNAT family N-acetyltransferase [Lysobacter pythonis]